MKLTWQRRPVHLHHPFNIAGQSDKRGAEKDVLLIRIEHAGMVGFGEAAPASYHGQSLESSEEVFAEAQNMLGNDPFALDDILDPIWKRFPDQPAAIAAVDSALHDLVGKILQVPIWKLLGLNPARMPTTSFSIGIDEPDIIAQKVREAQEFPILKIKVGTEHDQATLDIVRQAAPDKPLRVDANGAWSSDNVLYRCGRIADYGIELIEQPTPPNDHQALPALRAKGIAPLIADESCMGIEDVLNCAGLFDGINIKLCKCGGIRRALQMIHTARAAGLKVMLGCMVETSVGIAAAAQLAPLADYLDLDGHLLLADDPFEGIGGSAGRLTLTNRPGLGLIER